MNKTIVTALLLLFIAIPARAADGMVSVRSSHDVKETADRLVRVLKEKGMTLFNRIPHSAAAGKVGIDLRETELIIFGNPKVGSLLMQCGQSVAIDLPQKALVWQDDKAQVWISYNDPGYLAKRHGLAGCEEVITKIDKVLAGIAESAAGK